MKEETSRRHLGVDQWNQKCDQLVVLICDNKTLPATEYSPLMLLAALDKAIVDLGKEDGGLRVVPYRHHVQGQDWLLVRRVVPLGVRKHLQQFAHLRNWLNYHLIVPAHYPHYAAKCSHALEIRFCPPKDHGKSLNVLGGDSLPVWFGTFTDQVTPHWPNIQEKKCTSERVTDQDKRWASIKDSLCAAREAEAKVVIFPELSVCPSLRKKILDWLNNEQNGFLLVVPGSFHEQVERTTSHGLPVNRTGLFTGKGNHIFWHDKFIPFGDDKVCHELVSSGNAVTLWMTSIGVFALAVCRDFCEGEGWVRTLWETLAPDWVLVPSMSFSGGMSAHLKQAANLYDHCGTRVLVANQWPQESYPNKNPCEHGFAFPMPGGGRGEQEVTSAPYGRLKCLKPPSHLADKSIV
ncbi:MAG: hypothetical protein H7839_07800 [Magnetococcus sp. YQC-5]